MSNPRDDKSTNLGDRMPSDATSEPVHGIRVMNSEFPIYGQPLAVAPGIWWLRLPLHGALDHVNVYCIEDEDGMTLVDCGSNISAIEAIYKRLPELGSPFDRKVHRVIVTHYHPDHIGMAGFFVEKGAELWTTRTAWLQAQVLRHEDRLSPCREQIEFVRRAGLDGLPLAAYCRRPPSSYRNLVYPLPYSYRRIQSGDTLSIGDRKWKVLVGDGHAAEHAVLLSEDGIAITGDQILLGIATNLSLHPTEPEADLVDEWLTSCGRLAKSIDDDVLCLPGHNLPFFGAASRCQQLIANIEAALRRVLNSLTKPKTVVECLNSVYGRVLRPEEHTQSLAETMGFMNHLNRRGYVRKLPSPQGQVRWLRIASEPYQLSAEQVAD